MLTAGLIPYAEIWVVVLEGGLKIVSASTRDRYRKVRSQSMHVTIVNRFRLVTHLSWRTIKPRLGDLGLFDEHDVDDDDKMNR